MGDDLISAVFCSFSPAVREELFAIYRQAARGLFLDLHPVDEKGFLSDSLRDYEFCSRRAFSAHLSVRDNDDTIGSLVNPEHTTSSFAHLLLRVIGLLFDNPLNMCTEILLRILISLRVVVKEQLADVDNANKH